jgi:hypothetical protein
MIDLGAAVLPRPEKRPDADDGECEHDQHDQVTE